MRLYPRLSKGGKVITFHWLEIGKKSHVIWWVYSLQNRIGVESLAEKLRTVGLAVSVELKKIRVSAKAVTFVRLKLKHRKKL